MDEQTNDLPTAPQRKSLVGSGDGKEVMENEGIILRDGAGDSCLRRAIAAFSYDQVHPDELQLEVGDIIEVLGQDEEGWLRGRLKGKVGVFPAAFVKMQESTECLNDDDCAEKNACGEEKSWTVLETSVTASTQEKKDEAEVSVVQVVLKNPEMPKDQPEQTSSLVLNLTTSSSNSIIDDQSAQLNDSNSDLEREKSKDNVSEVELTSSPTLPEALPSTKPVDHGNRSILDIKSNLEGSLKQVFASKLMGSFDGHSPVTSAKPKEYGKVIQSHQAEKDGQLSLQVGNVVTILSQEVEGAQDEWLGEVSNKRGTFPSSCVVPITAEEAEKIQSKPSPSVGAPPPLPFKPPKLKPVVLPPSESVKRSTAEVQPESPAPPKLLPIVPKAMEEKPTKVSSPTVGNKSEKIGAKSGQILTGLGKHLPSWLKTGREKSPSPAKNGERMVPTESKPDDFGGAVREGESLSHLTAQRPRNPGKRPPSQAFLKEMAVGQPPSASSVSTKTSSPILPPKALPALPSLPKKPPRSRSPTDEEKNEDHAVPDGSKSEYVRREEFDQLVASFEAFRREATNQIRELEKRLAASEKLEAA